MRTIFLLTTATLALAPTVVAAQVRTTADPVPSEEVSNAAGPDQSGLGDIVVTAQKRAENLQDVPISVFVADDETLENKGVDNTAEIGTVAAGVTVRNTSSAFLPYIRGVGTNSSGTESPVSLYVDGIYQPYSRGGLRDLGDVEQIAVLKGPQGTLFGRNSTAGVIQITTRRPTQDFRFRAQASIDNYATVNSRFNVSGGLSDNIAVALSAQYSTQGEGWGRNFTTGNDTHRLDHMMNIRGKLAFDPGPNTAITLIGEFFKQRFEGHARVPYPGTFLAYTGGGPLPSKYDSYADTDGFFDNKGHSVSLKIDQDLGFANLVSISAYQYLHATLAFDLDGVDRLLFLTEGDQPNRVYTQELQLVSSTSGPFQWVIGGFYFNNKEKSDPSKTTGRAPFFGGPPNSTTYIRRDGTQSTESLAGFAQGTLEFVEGTSLTLGARYTWEKRDFSGAQTFGFVPSTGPGTFIFSSQTIKRPSFRVALDHEFTPDVLGYVSFNTGFKSGGYNLIAPLSPPFLPEKIKAYETGLKTQLLDRRLRLNIAAFYNDYTNIQVTQTINGLQTVSNAAKAETYGVDVEMQAAITPNLQISGAASILHAEYTDYPGARFATPRPLPAGGAVLTTGNAAGNRLPASQEFSANLALDYDTELLGAKLHYNLTGAYQGDYYLEPDNFIRQPSYVTLNTSVRLTLPGDRVSVTLFGKNLLDEKVITNGSAAATGVTVVYDAAPRTYGFQINYAF